MNGHKQIRAVLMGDFRNRTASRTGIHLSGVWQRIDSVISQNSARFWQLPVRRVFLRTVAANRAGYRCRRVRGRAS